MGTLTGELSDFMDFGYYDLGYSAPVAEPERYSEKTRNGRCPYLFLMQSCKPHFLIFLFLPVGMRWNLSPVVM